MESKESAVLEADFKQNVLTLIDDLKGYLALKHVFVLLILKVVGDILNEVAVFKIQFLHNLNVAAIDNFILNYWKHYLFLLLIAEAIL